MNDETHKKETALAYTISNLKNVIKNLFLICLHFVIMQFAAEHEDSATSKELVIPDK